MEKNFEKLNLDCGVAILNQNQKRLDFLDYAKALSIFFVVFIHVGFSFLNNVALFAMPVFFMVTGCTFTSGKRSPAKSIFQRFKSVLVPFWIYMAIYTVLEVLRAYAFGYGNWEIIFPSIANGVYGSGIIPINNQLTAFLKEIMSYKQQVDVGVDLILPANCHLWFLPSMFVAYSFFVLIADKTLKNHLIKFVVVVVLLAICSLEVIFPQLCQLPYGVGRGALGTIYMLVGFWIKEYKLFEKNSIAFHTVTCIICCALYVLALLLGSDGSIFVRSYYGPHGPLSVVLTLIGGVAGGWLVFELCRLIEKVPLVKVKKVLAFSGRNVMTVYALHIAIKIVFDLIYVKVICGGNALLDQFKMGLLPESAGFYMVFESIAIIVVCLLIAKLLKMKKRVKK